jgi:poly(A) polymerase Pap1
MAGTALWSGLFSNHDFFHKYRNYIQVFALTRDAQLRIKWYARPFLPSGIRFLELPQY